ncbi:MAG: lysophospholipid acyltransferase family protein [Solirubrobacterales bacterium]
MTATAANPESFTKTYRLAMALCAPLRWWSGMEVDGLEVLPRSGPVLLVGNHDSQSDPVIIGMAARRRRQIRALAKSGLWQIRGLGPLLNGMGQIPIERAAGDADALVNAIAALREGKCIGVFPEGTISVGRKLRARSGIGRLALEVPEAKIICAAHTGTPDFARFPTKPKVRVRFFEPASGQADPGEDPAALSQRLLDEIRAIAPQVEAGRDPAKTLAHYQEKAAKQEARRQERAKQTAG